MKKSDKDREITLRNLKRLVDELPEIAKANPDIYYGFNMFQYGVASFKEPGFDINECRTVGCLLGHSVRVFGDHRDDYILNKKFSYLKFSKRIFPELEAKCSFGYAIRNMKWTFLFDPGWVSHDNTFEGAIARAKYLIANFDDHDTYDDIINNMDRFKEGWHLGTEYETKLV